MKRSLRAKASRFFGGLIALIVTMILLITWPMLKPRLESHLRRQTTMNQQQGTDEPEDEGGPQYDWPEYRKTATVRAIQLQGPEDLIGDGRVYLAKHDPDTGDFISVDTPEESTGFGVETLEGDHFGAWGSYLCLGIENELWPVKREIFEATYERVDAESGSEA